MAQSSQHDRTRRLIVASVVTSAALFVGLALAHLRSGSQLALAQAADSISDVATGLGLLWAMHVSRQPPDADHHFGHRGAQPVAGLTVAVLTGVLAVEVAREAIEALLSAEPAALGWSGAAVLGGKAALRGGFAWLARSDRRDPHRPLLRALQVDCRNDAVIGVASVLGYFAADATAMPSLDSWLALPVAAWIGLSAFSLATDSVPLLMGVAPDSERQDELTRIAEQVEGVARVQTLKARHDGTELRIWLEIRVDPNLSLRAAHDIGEAVEARLLEQPGICGVTAHVDAETEPQTAPPQPAPDAAASDRGS